MQLIIEARYNGPPDSGNGGYSSGLFAHASGLVGPGPGQAVQVTLRRPPPLAVPLAVVPAGPEQPTTLRRVEDGLVIAEARTAELPEEVVPPVSWGTAVDAARDYPGFTDHPFPTCYVCGPAHPDGLRIFPGRLPDGRTAAPFTVPSEVSQETVWAALDCPGGWAVLSPGRPYVLGRMSATVLALPTAGDGCVVVGQMLASQGRKAEVRTSLYDSSGELLAYARATWIAIAPV